MKNLVVKTAIREYVKQEGYAISLKAFDTVNKRVEEMLEKAMKRAELHKVKVIKTKHL